MRLLLSGDWHLTDKTPENRIDDYPETQFEKIKWIFELAMEHGCHAILQPGDFFDSAFVKNSLLRKYIMLSLNYDIQLIVTMGQHDQRYHNTDLTNTPISVLDGAWAVSILKKPKKLAVFGKDKRQIIVYPAGWEVDIPKPENKDDFNILLCHKMIIADEKLWAQQSGHLRANHLLRQSGYDLIVSGDNHSSFKAVSRDGKRHLVNCGSLMRSNTTQMEHKPRVYIYDVAHNIMEEHFVPISPIRDVMTKDVEAAKERNLELESFIERLGGEEDIQGLDYKKNMIEFIKANEIEDRPKELIEKIMRGDL